VADNPKAFKHGLDRAAIRRIARNIGAVEPSFPGRAFVRTATSGLEPLEFKARVGHIAGALRKHLPPDERDAKDVLVRAGAAWDASHAIGEFNLKV